MKSLFGKIFGKPVQEKGEVQAKASLKNPVIDNQRFAGFYKPGDLIRQDYEVHKILGIGGCGIVYLIYSRSNKSIYALKTFRDDFMTESSVRDRFRQEAEVWINLERHPFLVRAHFVEEIEGRLFVGMEYIAPNEDGINSLSDYLERGPISLERCLLWAIQFCYGMEHAYSKGIRCHRDIKPANIMIDQNAVVKISDFGLAGVLHTPDLPLTDSRKEEITSSNAVQTLQGLSFGTPTHMPPEQFIDAAQCDERSDIYSFGVVLHQMQNNGALPYIAPLPKDASQAEQMHFWQTMYQLHCKAPVPNCALPIGHIIKQCLAKESSNRYQTFADLRSDFERIFFDKTGKTIAPPDVHELDAWEWNNKGGSFFRLGQAERALDCFDKALEIAPWFVEIWANKAVLFQSLGRMNESLSCFNKALELDPHNAHALTGKGSLFNQIHRYDQAIGCFEEALRVNDNLYDAWSKYGDALMGLARFDDALACFEKSLALYHKAAEVWHHKAICLQALGNAEAAVQCCDKAIDINPQLTAAYNIKALSLTTLGNYEAAYSAIKQALTIEPSLSMALFTRAGIEYELGKDLDAINSYREFLKVSSHGDNEIIQYANNRIRELEKKHDETTSIKAAKQRVAIEASAYPGKSPHISALNNLASSYISEKQYDKAISIYNEALSIIESKWGPSSPVILLAPTLNNLANLYHKLGKYIEAKNLYERAIQIIENDTSYGPDDQNLGTFLTNLAALQNDLGKHSESQSLCERALQIKEKAFGPDAVQLVSTLEQYAEALNKNGLEGKVAEVKSRLMRLNRRPLG